MRGGNKNRNKKGSKNITTTHYQQMGRYNIFKIKREVLSIKMDSQVQSFHHDQDL